MISAINRLRAKKGFTLIEAIVVIMIIGVLTAMILPALTYDNKPSIGKGMAKDAFYKAQDVLASSEIAYPNVLSGVNEVYYVDIDEFGNMKKCGPAEVTVSVDGGGNSTVVVKKNDFPTLAAGETNAYKIDRDKFYKKLHDEFNNYAEYGDNMEGTLYFVVDKEFRCTAAYWTDHIDFNGSGNISDTCMLSDGYYCCAFPVMLSYAGQRIFTTYGVGA